jgi:hypothetical protein
MMERRLLKPSGTSQSPRLELAFTAARLPSSWPPWGPPAGDEGVRSLLGKVGPVRGGQEEQLRGRVPAHRYLHENENGESYGGGGVAGNDGSDTNSWSLGFDEMLFALHLSHCFIGCSYDLINS